MKRRITFTIGMLLAALTVGATDYYISPTGDDGNPGTAKTSPWASITKAQEMLKAGDTLYILPGTYQVREADMMDRSSSKVWDIVYDFAKSGTETQHICYKGVAGDDGQRPVFDLSAIDTGKRITAFYVRGKYLDFSGFEIVGLRVPKSSSNTQSENIRVNGGSHCTFDYIAAHDGMGIGFYLTGKSDHNVLTNCDAYNNFDSVNIDVNNGGNSDGFGCHVSAGCEGNRFVRCRAWQNSDDGFDFINCLSVAEAEYCIAYRNGYDKNGEKRADGNGFKAGGYGMGKEVSITEVPMHVVQHCISVGNKANGFYANHHLGGVRLEYNTAYKNGGYAYSMVCRRGPSLDDAVDVDGKGHVLKYNLAYGSTKVVASLDAANSELAGNSFAYNDGAWTNEEFANSDFESLSVSELTAERNSDGSLPTITFMQLADKSKNYGYGSFQSVLTIHLFGDSTMAAYDEASVTKGWGQYLGDYLSSDLLVSNWAHTGYTVKNGNNLAWKEARDNIQAGDYAIIQFAHNDEKNQSGDDYKTYLTYLVKNIKGKKATPILLTSVCRNLMKDGKVMGQTGSNKAYTGLHEEYSVYMKEVATEQEVVCLDMTEQTRLLLEGIGTERAAELLFDGGYTHSSQLGAEVNARLAATLLYDNHVLSEHILAEGIVNMAELIEVLKQKSATGIIFTAGHRQPESHTYYTLSGMATQKPLAPGIYIYNRKKVVVK